VTADLFPRTYPPDRITKQTPAFCGEEGLPIEEDDSMDILTYLKAVTGAVGVSVFPPLADWAVSYLTFMPDNAQKALSILLVALLTGGAVYSVPNKSQGAGQPTNKSEGAGQPVTKPA
jgi:hypothetical protein